MRLQACIFGLLAGILGAWLYDLVRPRLASADQEKLMQAWHAANTSTSRPQEPLVDHAAQSSNAQKQTPSSTEDLVAAAEKSTESVIFIRSTSEAEYWSNDWLEWFLGGGRTQRKTTAGSGVIFTQDGYIVTNHHVIEDAERIEVVHHKNTYKAKLIGEDPSTDIAVVKIEAEDLPILQIGNSDEVRIGEWVLAVGNPFNLNSTVTAGIVSAKGRAINILEDLFPIESFIQTDAAINPGNSGGALVNARGELIGINTAILSKTGYYTGYGFAVPVNIVRKVVHDLIEYQEVQKAFTGMELRDIDTELAAQLALSSAEGILVTGVRPDGAADRAGIRKEDIILTLAGKALNSKAEIEERIGYAYPGDVVQLELRRKNRTRTVALTLLNREGHTQRLKRQIYYSETYGVALEAISKVEKELFKISHGVRIRRTSHGFFKKHFSEGFIITYINKTPIKKPEDVEKTLRYNKHRSLRIEGLTPDGRPRGFQFYR